MGLESQLLFPQNQTKIMASTSMIQTFVKWATIKHPQIDPKSREHQIQSQNEASSLPIFDLPKPTTPISRRLFAVILTPAVSITLSSSSLSSVALARERRNRKTIPIEDYLTGPEGLKYYDLVEGKGPVAVKGSTVQVHFDCVYRGITAVSSRESKLLAGNRIIAQPYEFKVGSTPGRERKREYVDNPNGLFSAQAAPKPPPALYFITEGMKLGGKRTVIVPPELGYGQKGNNEIPPGATFDLNIELLQVIPPEGNN